MATEILASPHSDMRHLCKLFPFLNINKEDLPSVKELHLLLEKLLTGESTVPDKAHRKALDRVRVALAPVVGISPVKEPLLKKAAGPTTPKGVTFEKTAKRPREDEVSDEESAKAATTPSRSTDGAPLRARLPPPKVAHQQSASTLLI